MVHPTGLVMPLALPLLQATLVMAFPRHLVTCTDACPVNPCIYLFVCLSCTHLKVQSSTLICRCRCVCVYIYVYAYVYVYMYVYIVCMYVCMYVHLRQGKLVTQESNQKGSHPPLVACCSTVHVLDKECHQPGTPFSWALISMSDLS